MICINGDTFIENNEDLQEFCNLMEGEIYDDDSNSLIFCLIDYFREVWSKSKILENDVKKRINKDLFVVIFLNFSITDNFSQISANLASLEEDMKINKRDEIVFEQAFQRYFKKTKPLRERLSEL